MDVPIVDVGLQPVTATTGTGTNLGTWSNNPGDTNPTDWGNYMWFDPLAIYCSSPEVTVEDCAFFCEQCAGVLFPELVNTNTLPAGNPQFPDFSPNNIMALGICEIFRQWLWATFIAGINNTAEVPYIPPSPSNGPGIWG